ncbi:hypothetical protein QE152_g37045 [Popillia japonica]|uniref:Uncharacterized protein n=1 Tax=Popillia japonica TaxID=7064 RepID=A0AAW1IBR6_POPJA
MTVKDRMAALANDLVHGGPNPGEDLSRTVSPRAHVYAVGSSHIGKTDIDGGVFPKRIIELTAVTISYGAIKSILEWKTTRGNTVFLLNVMTFVYAKNMEVVANKNSRSTGVRWEIRRQQELTPEFQIYFIPHNIEEIPIRRQQELTPEFQIYFIPHNIEEIPAGSCTGYT